MKKKQTEYICDCKGVCRCTSCDEDGPRVYGCEEFTVHDNNVMVVNKLSGKQRAQEVAGCSELPLSSSH